jgi:DNA-binding SARP family transcriptional activator
MDFQILGPLRVTSDGRRAIALGGQKPAAVLAMLLLHPNELIPSDRLIEDLWDGQPPATAAKTLQVHVSRLRRALAEGQNGDHPVEIVTTAGGYMLDVDPQQIDAFRFQTLVSEGQGALAEAAYARASARLRAALALWRGEALADFAYSSFAQDTIARLDGLRTVASESAVEAELALGRHAELIPELKSLVKRHPLSERLRAQLMLALYRSGRQAEALGVYRAARRVLVEQLGIEPSSELRELERAILAQDAGIAAPSAQARPSHRRAESSSRGALVGYERELGALEDLLERALAGEGALALIAGEPGVGKTRLADELAAVAGARGAEVVWGRAAVGTGAPAYWAWIQVLRALLSERDALAVRAELGAGAAELAELLPELRDVVPDLAPVERLDAEDVRFLLFDATARFLARAASERPIVIVLDDLHSADQSTRSLFEFVAPAVLDARILIVATYRDTEVAGDASLAATLTAITRATDCLQLVLTGLGVDDTTHLVEMNARIAPLPMLAAAIHDASAGNPLFVSELIRLLAAEDRLHELERETQLALPRGVDQVIARRLEHLSEASRQTLSLAAVIGREFDVVSLAGVASAEAGELLGHIDEAVAARIVEPLPAGERAFRFSHDLIRQALHSRLAPAERCRLHEAVGLALEQRHGAHPQQALDQLAYHFSEALPLGDPAKALDYLIRAGEAAADISAIPEAAAHYARAVDVAKTSDAGAEHLCELNVRLGEQLVLLGDLHGAKAPIQEAAGLAPSVPDRVRDARLAAASAHLALLDTSTFDEERIFDAIELFEEIGDHASAARAWWAIANVRCGQSERLQGAESCERMLECARRSGSIALTNEGRRHLAVLLSMGTVPASQALARIHALMEEMTDAGVRARMLMYIAWLKAKLGHFDEARALLADATALAPPASRAHVEAYAVTYGARIELLAGNLHRAEELGRVQAADLRSQGLVRFLSSELLTLVDALIGLGRLEEASAELEQAVSVTAPDDIDALLRQARSRARLALARGDSAAAETWARDAVRHAEGANAPDEYPDCLLVLARTLLAAGRESEARAAAAKALRASVENEHAVLAQRARDMLGAAAPVAV